MIALTKEEVFEITGFIRPSRQIEALIEMDIKFWIRPNGTPCVPRSLDSATAPTETKTNSEKVRFNPLA